MVIGNYVSEATVQPDYGSIRDGQHLFSKIQNSETSGAMLVW